MKQLSVILFLLFVSIQISWGQTNACLESQSFKIVVLGSSTAAGAGVSTPDSAWVNQYRKYVKDINVNNEVVNLAVGGYNTYKIMPSGFVPPANRPLSDTSKNITKALSLNPDAIIVNLPSNDVSSGYSVNEQLYNLDSVFTLANQNNVPIWICTTQPKNYSSAALRQLQEDIKDSINLKYGSFAIDFWTTIALPDNSIDSVYNADGTHLNDAGHHILVNRVIGANILTYLYSSINYTDYWARNILNEMSSLCGDSLTPFTVVVANIGDSSLASTTVYFELENLTSGQLTLDSIQLASPIIPCSYDSIIFYGNTSNIGEYKATGVIKNQNDTILDNDSVWINFSSIGHPSMHIIHDTLCAPGLAVLETNSDSNDYTFWYLNPLDSNEIATGSTFQTPLINYSSDWFVETVRGELFYSGSLQTTTSSNINWNGAMFDLVADTNIFVDSFDVKIASLGTQLVEVYYKSGSYIGYELDAPSWTLLGITSVNVQSVDGFTSVPLANLPIIAGDTVGIYIQLSNPSSQLSYQYASSPVTRSNNELTVITGSGISHNHMGSYYPRDWNGKVYYHFGDRPGGECKTNRFAAHAFVSQTTLDIGSDTIIDIADSVTFSGPNDAISYLWSDGSTNQNLFISAADLGVGIHYVSLEITDSLKCIVTDELVLGIADLVSVQEIESKELTVYPNPVRNYIQIDVDHIESISIFSLDGSLVLQQNGNGNRVDVTLLNQGVYLLTISTESGKYYSKFVKQ